MTEYNCRAAYTNKSSEDFPNATRAEEFLAATPREAVERATARKGEDDIHSVWLQYRLARLLWIGGEYQEDIPPDEQLEEIFYPFLS